MHNYKVINSKAIYNVVVQSIGEIECLHLGRGRVKVYCTYIILVSVLNTTHVLCIIM